MKKSKQPRRTVKSLRLTPQGETSPLLCHLVFADGDEATFEMDAKAAMTVMVALQAYQQRYHWPIPLKRIFRAGKK